MSYLIMGQGSYCLKSSLRYKHEYVVFNPTTLSVLTLDRMKECGLC